MRSCATDPAGPVPKGYAFISSVRLAECDVPDPDIGGDHMPRADSAAS
jgi:hypothetical protein